MNANCIFCKIIKGQIPSYKLLETELTYAFLDINPLNAGHCLVIPKYCAKYMHQLPDEHLQDLLPVAKKIVLALGPDNYNILQNNGRLAHQEVEHVHFHIIPKDAKGGLGVGWKSLKPTQEELQKVASDLIQKLQQ